MKPFIQLGNEESYNMPRQKLPKVFSHDGVVDVIRVSTILEKKTLTGSRVLPLRIEDSFFSVDIDEPIDLIMAEVFLKYNKAREKLL
jgi:N-acylneuraminate cytidylyltransferase